MSDNYWNSNINQHAISGNQASYAHVLTPVEKAMEAKKFVE